MTVQTWYQVEFLSHLEEDRWIPLFGRHIEIESARQASRQIHAGTVRIVHITRTMEIVV